MKWFNDLKLRTKLLVGFGLVALITTVVGWAGLSATSSSNAALQTMYANQLLPVEHLSNASVALQTTRGDIWRMTQEKQRADRQKLADNIDEQTRTFDEQVAEYAKSTLTDKEQTLLAQLRPAFERYRTARKAALEQILRGEGDGVQNIVNIRPLLDEVRRNLKDLISLSAKTADEEAKSNSAAAAAARYRILFFLGIGILVALTVGFLVTRTLTGALRNLKSAAEMLAEGATDVQIDVQTKDEIGDLAQAFRHMAGTVKQRSNEVHRIAAGDLNLDVQTKSGRDVLGASLIKAVQTLKALMGETERLAKAAVAGELSTRGQADKFEGDYRKIVEGFNGTLDAVIGPLNVAAEYVDRISKGDIPPKITDCYKRRFQRDQEQPESTASTSSIALLPDMNRMADEHNRRRYRRGDPAPIEFGGALPADGAGRQRHGGRAHLGEEEGHGLCRRVLEGQLRRSARAVPRQEGVHQRQHRTAAQQRETVHRRNETDVGGAQQGRHRRGHPGGTVRGHLPRDGSGRQRHGGWAYLGEKEGHGLRRTSSRRATSTPRSSSSPARRRSSTTASNGCAAT